MTSGGRVQGLDLLRGIAVGLVLLRHALPEVFPGAGVVGVVMATVVWLSEAPELAYALPTSWAVCFVIGAAVRLYADGCLAWDRPL